MVYATGSFVCGKIMGNKRNTENKNMSIDDTIKRINELAHKSKAEGLTDAEKAEQQELRNIYRKAVLGNLTSQLDNMSIKHPDGTITPVKKKHD